MFEYKEKDLNEYLENIKAQISEEKFTTLKYLFNQINEKYDSEKKLLKTNEEIKLRRYFILYRIYPYLNNRLRIKI